MILIISQETRRSLEKSADRLLIGWTAVSEDEVP